MPLPRNFISWLALATLAAGRLGAAERVFDFSGFATNQPPTNCLSTVAGEGQPGDWRVLLDDVPLAADAFTTNAGRMAKKSVVAQVARNVTDEHFPVLMLGDESYGDFTFTTRFKIVDGQKEQMAGVAFRMQDNKNFYVARASALSGTFYFYKFEHGQRTAPIGNNIKIEKGVWHELTVHCEGTKIHLLLDGKEAMPELSDPTYSAGKIGFFTKSDSVSYFTDARITYTPRVRFAQQLVDDAAKDNPRLLGLQVYIASGESGTKMIASMDPKEIGQPGDKADEDVIQRGVRYYRKETSAAVVTMPLCDRNGDPVASVRVILRPLFGQTEDNAVIRALPIVKSMQAHLSTVKSLMD